ncbi:MAG: PIN domain-containing protein [Pirellulaceae bacterium]|nr:PIN domain-containing protein [Pirellulaceae bacterium]
MKFLLDTDVCIAVMKGKPKAVEHLSFIPREQLFVSSITVYELFTGIAKCSRPHEEQEKVEKLISLLQVVAFDSDSAKIAAAIRAKLESRGEMIGPYDVLIAAQAISCDLTVATRNAREFFRVENLQIADWTS